MPLVRRSHRDSITPQVIGGQCTLQTFNHTLLKERKTFFDVPPVPPMIISPCLDVVLRAQISLTLENIM